MRSRWGQLCATLVLGIVLAFFGILPPSPKTTSAPEDQFSTGRAMTDIRIIAAKPHPTGTLENEKVRHYLVKRLMELGLEVSVSDSQITGPPLAKLNSWSGQSKTSQTIYNIIAVKPGVDRTKPALLLMAHYDTVWASPGAADDTIGVAAILEIIRALNQEMCSQRDLVVLFTDAEEVGLSGATHFFNNHPLREKIGAIINFEARGGGGTANMFQTSAENGALARLYARAVKTPSASSLSTYVYNLLPNDTDLTPALEKGYVAFNIANIGDAAYYHSPKIDVNALDQATVQHMGAQGLDLTRALLSSDPFPDTAPDATFFDVFGFFTLIYSPFWGWVLLLLSAVFYALVVRPVFEIRSFSVGIVKMTGFILIGGVFLYVLNKLSGAGLSDNYYDRLAAIPKLESVAFFLCLGLFFAMMSRRPLDVNQQVGMAVPLLILGIVGQALAPTATYFISVSLFLCGMACFAVSKWSDRFIGVGGAVISTGAVIGYMLVLGHLLLLGVGPDLLSVAVLPAAIATLAILPLQPKIKPRVSKYFAAGSLILALGITLLIRFDPIASTVPVY